MRKKDEKVDEPEMKPPVSPAGPIPMGKIKAKEPTPKTDEIEDDGDFPEIRDIEEEKPQEPPEEEKPPEDNGIQ